MIRSMTGFGRASAQTEHFGIQVEVWSVNNRNLRVVCRLPERMQGLDGEAEGIIRKALSRGSVTMSVELEDLTGDPGYILEPGAIEFYRKSIRAVSGEQNLPPADLPLSVLITLPGVVRRSRSSKDVPPELWQAVQSALAEALDKLRDAREREGTLIWQDMMERCRIIGALTDRVEKRVPQMVVAYRQRLLDRLGRLLEGTGAKVTEQDLHREIALFADRADITEEITRLRSHLQMMCELEKTPDPCGRRVEFIAQELFREANTMASKSCEAEQVQCVLEIKAEIEKLREQALNIE